MKNFFDVISKKISTMSKSVDEYKEITKTTPLPSRAFINWGVYLATIGDLDKAIEKFEISSNMSPKNPESLTNWGVALAKKGKFDEAIEKFIAALKVDSKYSRAYSLWGAALVELGKMDEAEKKYEEAIKLNPKDSDTYINWGIALAKQSRKIAAEEKFKKAVSMNPRSLQAMFLHGVILAELEKYDEALLKLDLVIKSMQNHSDAWHYTSICMLKKNMTKEAFDRAKKAIAINPLKIEYHINAGEILATHGKYSESIECFKIAEKLNHSSSELYVSWGVSLQKSGEHHEAIQKIEKALELKPTSAEALYHIGLSLAETGECERAIEVLTKAYENDSRYTDVFTKIGSIYNILGEPIKAIESYEKSMSLTRKNSLVNFLIASTYYNMFDMQNAIKYYNKTIEYHPDHLEAHVTLAIALSETGEQKEAIRKIRAAYKLQPTSHNVNFIYGMILSKDDKSLKEAIEKFDRAISISNDEVSVHIAKGEALIKLKRYNEAITIYNEILAKAPDFVVAIFMLGVTYVEMADDTGNTSLYSNARECFNKTLNLNHNHVESYANLAYIKAKLGDFDGFERDYRKLYSEHIESRAIILEYLIASVTKLKYQKHIKEIIGEF
ncbi:MAG: tetratricopeptide repeat protein [bacterium]